MIRKSLVLIMSPLIFTVDVMQRNIKLSEAGSGMIALEYRRGGTRYQTW